MKLNKNIDFDINIAEISQLIKEMDSDEQATLISMLSRNNEDEFIWNRQLSYIVDSQYLTDSGKELMKSIGYFINEKSDQT